MERSTDPTTEEWGILNVEPCSNWRPGQKMRTRKPAEHTVKAAISMLRSAARRDDFGGLNDYEFLGELRHVVDDVLDRSVARLRAEGASWAEIGDALGMTRQSAWERWR